MQFWNKPQLTQANRVIINVWFPKVNGTVCTATEFIRAHLNNQTDPRTSHIGHASFETANKYASWWPNPKNGEQLGMFNVVGAQNSTYVQDCLSEGGAPDLRICLYSLDGSEIENCFANIEQDPNYGYVLAGDKKLTRLLNDEKGQSCCGLAYELLAAGGLLKLSTFHKDLKVKWIVVTPDNFAELIKNAKQTEWNTYPETHTFPTVAGEYVPQPVASSNWCPII